MTLQDDPEASFAASLEEEAIYCDIARREFLRVMGIDLDRLYPGFGTPKPERQVVLFRKQQTIIGGAELWVGSLADTSAVPLVNRVSQPRDLVRGLPLQGDRFITPIAFAVAEEHRSSWESVVQILQQLGRLERCFCDENGVDFKIMVSDYAHLLLYEMAGDELLSDGLVLHETEHSMVVPEYAGRELLFHVIYRRPT